MKTKEKTYKEFEDAPSGECYFYNYKEPLMDFKEGYGFQGALVYDSTSDQIQCHFCGGWFDILQHHLKKEHAMTAPQYKKAVGLNKTTALISERHRALLIKKGLEIRLKNLRPHKSHSEKAKAKIGSSRKDNRMEGKNTLNTCPEQLLERLTKTYNEIGATPPLRQVPFKESLLRVYGTYKNACDLAGIPLPVMGRPLSKRVTRDAVIERVARFYQEHGRFPKATEYKSYASHLLKFGKKEILKRAAMNDGVYRKLEFRPSYTKEELLNFLRMFKKLNGRVPSCSDAKRGLLPYPSRYIYHFGSWETARKLAFPDYKPEPKKERLVKTRVKGLNNLERMSLRLARHVAMQIK